MVQRDEYIEKVFFAKKVFSKNDAAQQSVQLTVGTRRVFWHFSGFGLARP